MKVVIAISVILSLFYVCDAQSFGWGKCPQPETKEDFNIDQYLGVWYEVLRTRFVVFEYGLRCVTAEYSDLGEGSIKVLNSGTSTRWRTQGEQEASEGNARVVDPDEPAKLVVNFDESPITSQTANYLVVDTDYDTYSIVYSCQEFVLFHYDIVWVLGRTQELDEELKKTLLEKIKDQGIRSELLVEQDQSCPADTYGS